MYALDEYVDKQCGCTWSKNVWQNEETCHAWLIQTYSFFPECVAKGGRAVFARRCFRVRNRPQPSSSVRIRALWHCRWGELWKVTFHGCVTCQFAPLFHCDLHKSGMSCKKGDAIPCAGAGFRESDTFCVVVTLGLAASEWCFRGVESRCYIGMT